MKQISNAKGFTLLEIMIALSIVAILALAAIPSRTGPVTQKKIIESLDLVDSYRESIEIYYHLNAGNFPEDNAAAKIPEPNKILGNYLQRLEVRDGVMHLFLGQKMPPELHGKILSWRPVYVKDSPSTKLSWVCGVSEVPEGMTGAGRNLTDVPALFLPGRCRV